MKLEKLPKTLYVTDGEDRGPLTMARVRFHPTKPVLLAQCVDRRLALWNLDAEPEKVDKKKEPYVVGSLVCPHELGWVRGFDVSPKGDFVVTGGSDRRLVRWNWQGDRPSETPAAKVAAHDGWVEAVAISPDGNTIATAGADHVAKLFDAKSLKPRKSLARHDGYVRDIAWSPDGKRVYTAAEDGLVVVWDASNGEIAGECDFGDANDQQGQNPRLSGCQRLAVSRDGRWLAIGGGSKVDVFDAMTFERVATETGVNHDVRFHGKRDCLAAGESKLEVWEYDAGEFVPAKVDSKGNPGKVSGVPGEKSNAVNRGEYSLGIDFSRDGHVMAVGRGDGTVELWNLV